MKKHLLIALILSLSTLYGCMESADNYTDKSAEEWLTVEKIYNKTNEGVDANKEANQNLQNLSDQFE